MWTESTREFLALKHIYLEVQSLSRRSRKYFDVKQVYLMRTSKNVSILLYRQKKIRQVLEDIQQVSSTWNLQVGFKVQSIELWGCQNMPPTHDLAGKKDIKIHFDEVYRSHHNMHVSACHQKLRGLYFLDEESYPNISIHSSGFSHQAIYLQHGFDICQCRIAQVRLQIQVGRMRSVCLIETCDYE